MCTGLLLNLNNKKMPAQHEHELESQHPMTPGSLRRELCRYERTRVSGPRKLVSAEIEHFKTPASQFPGFPLAVLRRLTRIRNIVNNIGSIQFNDCYN